MLTANLNRVCSRFLVTNLDQQDQLDTLHNMGYRDLKNSRLRFLKALTRCSITIFSTLLTNMTFIVGTRFFIGQPPHYSLELWSNRMDLRVLVAYLLIGIFGADALSCKPCNETVCQIVTNCTGSSTYGACGYGQVRIYNISLLNVMNTVLSHDRSISGHCQYPI